MHKQKYFSNISRIHIITSDIRIIYHINQINIHHILKLKCHYHEYISLLLKILKIEQEKCSMANQKVEKYILINLYLFFNI